MTFLRTAEGISAQHLFEGTDWILYCEGQAKSPEALCNDESFWRMIAQHSGKSVTVIPLGSKSNVADVAQKITNGDITSTIAAMDRDYDRFFENLVDHPNVVYTKGYSWESDIVSEELLTRQMRFFTRHRHEREQFEKLKDRLDAEIPKLRRMMLLDLRYQAIGEATLNRERPQSIIEFDWSCPPKVSQKRFLDRVRGNRKDAPYFPDPEVLKDLNPTRDFFGKSVLRFHYLSISYWAKEVGSTIKIQFDAFVGLTLEVIDIGFNNWKNGEYYLTAFGKVI